MTRIIDAEAFWGSVVQSRKETIITDDVKISMGELVKLLDNAPTVEERPQGEWIKLSNMSKRSYQRVCNQCHNISYFCGNGNYPNCPYCLAEMKREAENE